MNLTNIVVNSNVKKNCSIQKIPIIMAKNKTTFSKIFDYEKAKKDALKKFKNSVIEFRKGLISILSSKHGVILPTAVNISSANAVQKTKDEGCEFTLTSISTELHCLVFPNGEVSFRVFKRTEGKPDEECPTILKFKRITISRLKPYSGQIRFSELLGSMAKDMNSEE